jgi:hypothetical protein
MTMLEKIELFVFNLSVLYCLKYLIQVIMVLKQDDPTPIVPSNVEKIFLYLSISYIVTTIINVIA